VGASVIPAAVEQAGLVEGRTSDGADEPWAKVFSIGALGGPPFGGCVRSDLGPAVLVDLSAPSLRLGDDPRAVADGLVFLQAFIEGEATFTAADGARTTLRSGQVIVRPASAGAMTVAEAASRIVTLAVPKFLIAPRFVATEAIPPAGAVFQTSMAGRLLYDYLAGLAGGVRQGTVRPGRRPRRGSRRTGPAGRQRPPPNRPDSHRAVGRPSRSGTPPRPAEWPPSRRSGGR
jgi:hypothetical protein